MREPAFTAVRRSPAVTPSSATHLPSVAGEPTAHRPRPFASRTSVPAAFEPLIPRTGLAPRPRPPHLTAAGRLDKYMTIQGEDDGRRPATASLPTPGQVPA
ncbi:hypothetical protein PGH47_42325 (plasmid) [Streptomyces sp. HUAS 31]|uniref:hypothetical protein n=1 Tax=Streptomyces sp. HUAS 31 TaxID=3020055 RepID=UPI002305787F|nr:hypothetical protein [Streptomyces sp. HUAS 31]WCE02391.1 hypothetical protein PGH47_42325 [Streptomyces sp. HUAS 31]